MPFLQTEYRQSLVVWEKFGIKGMKKAGTTTRIYAVSNSLPNVFSPE